MTYHPFILSVLQNTSIERLQRAVTAITDNSLNVTFTRLSGADMRALVKNGDGKEYGVSIVGNTTTCSCPDALYRGVSCKHAIAVALFALSIPRTPDTASQSLVSVSQTKQSHTRTPAVASVSGSSTPQTAPQFPMFHLRWRDGIVLCGEHHPTRIQVWPWTESMLTWPEVCSSCVTAYKHPKTIMTKVA
jgi:hypothetical protein